MLVCEALEVLGLRMGSFDANDLKRVFRSEALRQHPDRGGTDGAYVRLEVAYRILKHELKRDTAAPLHDELRALSRGSVSASRAAAGVEEPVSTGMAAFNAKFEREHRLRVQRDVEDGYSEWLSQSVPDAPALKSFSHFEREFRERAKGMSTSLVVRAAPVCPSATCTLAPSLSDDAQATDDFSSAPSGHVSLAYSDLRLAHDARPLDPDEVRKYSHHKRAELRALLKEQEKGRA